MSEDRDIIDEDLFEDIDEEEMYELLQQAKRKLKPNSKKESQNVHFPNGHFGSFHLQCFFK
ncbi:hypothetical protein [Paracerasibacillus soli]|uniref:Uncharacterized protein n=1 Tax=Paracerasibacillus soli TaxID=480284 RepID=A0ABU5CPP1_9BACI|nr:hypothetical protein [Virgibacillus soli]MDY0407789.1 hypothetical protein [Virgibacillus soli]